MRRVILLALLAQTLPTAGCADSFTFNTGDFKHGRAVPQIYEVFGTDASIILDIFKRPTLDSTCFVSGANCYSFSGGRVFVLNPANGQVLFGDGVAGGIIATTGVIDSRYPSRIFCFSSSCSAIISADLGLNNTIDAASTTFSIVIGHGGTTDLTAGGATVTFQEAPPPPPVPEPSAFEALLFGTGLLGLVETARRKLQVGT